MSDKPASLDELFRRAGRVPRTPLPPVQRPVAGRARDPVQRFQRATKALLFATAYIETACDAVAAYRKAFAPHLKAYEERTGKRMADYRIRKRARRFVVHPVVSRAVTEQMRDMLATAVESATIDLKQLLMLNEAIIMGDATRYFRPDPPAVDQNGKPADQTGSFVIPDNAKWQDAVAIQQIAVDPDTGKVAGVKLYDRMAAMRFQVELLQLAAAKSGSLGGGERQRVAKLRQKLQEARIKANAIASGKVVPLITQQREKA